MSREIRAVLMMLAGVAAFGSIATPARAARVTAARLTASPSRYAGDCPAVIRFNGTITVDGPTVVTYIFTRSDGATDTIVKRLVFRAAGSKRVSTSWTLGGAELPYLRGWQAIKILRPNRLTSAHANFTLSCNPPLNSATSAHGNTDWHIDTAHEFLFGVDNSGTPSAANHAPDGWTKRHMHVGETHTAKYYYDHALSPTGDDANAINGIDKSMLFFYAGHGHPEGWSALGDSATQDYVRLANATGGGQLRYYWQCSCEVFAHGPKTCAGSSWDYPCPQSFVAGSADSDAMRNVFERWGPALRPDLRMACGASTSAYCHEWVTNKIWDNYNNRGMDVADAFIDGLSWYGVVPLCITIGGADVTRTPLYDTTFTNAPNTSGTSHYHIQYPAGFASTPRFLMRLVDIPLTLPRYRLHRPPPPEAIRQVLTREPAAQVLSSRLATQQRLALKLDPKSHAISLTAATRALPQAGRLEESAYLSRAQAFLKEQGLDETLTAAPMGVRYMVVTTPVEGANRQVSATQKSVQVTFKRQLQLEGGPRVNVLGEGGTIVVQMTNDGRVFNASKVWRQAEPVSAQITVKPYEKALAEAQRKLVNPEAYELGEWNWGYKELAGNVEQEELSLVYQFAFVPRKTVERRDHPPQMVEVSGDDAQ